MIPILMQDPKKKERIYMRKKYDQNYRPEHGLYLSSCGTKGKIYKQVILKKSFEEIKNLVKCRTVIKILLIIMELNKDLMFVRIVLNENWMNYTIIVLLKKKYIIHKKEENKKNKDNNKKDKKFHKFKWILQNKRLKSTFFNKIVKNSNDKKLFNLNNINVIIWIIV